MKEKVHIYSDGACRGNPGIGAYGTLVRKGSDTLELSGVEEQTTNNRMELTGAIVGLRQITEESHVVVVSDSEYLVKGMTTWIHNWIKKRWKTAGGKPVKNRELWEDLLELSKNHQVEWKWIKGHSGHAENERCDLLANQAMDENAYC